MTTLKCKNFLEDLAKSVNELWSNSDFADMTFHVKDAKNVNTFNFKAHKAVLSSGSPYFKRVLTEYSREEEPHISIDGLKKPEHFGLVLMYLYNGQVLIGQEDLEHVKSLFGTFELTFEHEEENPAQDEYGDNEVIKSDVEATEDIDSLIEREELEEPKEPEKKRRKTEETDKAETSKQYECSLCDYKTILKTCYISHIVTAHKQAEQTIETESNQDQEENGINESKLNSNLKKMKCKLCEFESLSQDKLLEHAKRHPGKLVPNIVKGSKPVESSQIFSCERCSAEFKCYHNLYVHMNKVQLHSCRLCNFVTCTRPKLQEHLSSVHGHKKFASFRQYGAVQQRENTKLFKCEVCSASFNTLQHLTCHRNKLRKYACHICDYITCRTDLMIEHESNVHGAKGLPPIVSCSLCDYKSASGSDFTKHFKNEHPDYKKYILL